MVGDWIYDYAKVFQSLFGYDAILLSEEKDDRKNSLGSSDSSTELSAPTNPSRVGGAVMDSFYRREMLKAFETTFYEIGGSLEDFESMRMVTKLLLFSLIPLHGFNANCVEFIKLCAEVPTVNWRSREKKAWSDDR